MDIQLVNQLYPNKNQNRDDDSSTYGQEERDPKLSALMQNFLGQTEITPKSTFDNLISLHECRWTQEQFIPTTSEPLLPKQNKLFSEHLRQCSSCNQEFQQFQQFKKSFVLPEVDAVRPLQQFWQKVQCREFQDDFVNFLKKELVESRSQEIQTHLTTCPSCSRIFRDIQNTLTHVTSVLNLEIEPSPQAWNNIQKAIASPLSKPSLSRWRLASSVVFMALGCLLVASLVWQKRVQPEPRLISGILNASSAPNTALYNNPLSTESCLAQLEMNGVRLLINKNTSFQLNSPHLIQIFQGEMLIEVPPGLGYNLTVETPNAKAVVLGTKFNIHTTKNQTDLAVFQGKVLFGGENKTTQALRGTEASVTGENTLAFRQMTSTSNAQEVQKLEEQLLKRYHQNALTLSLEKLSSQSFRIRFKNHGILPLKLVPIRSNSSAHSWSITGPYGKIQVPASPTLCLSTKPVSSIILKPGQEHLLDYDVSPYLSTSGDYELSLNYLFNEPRDDSFWTGHLQSNSIHIRHP